MFNAQCPNVLNIWFLKFDACLEFGAWNLEFPL